MEKRFCGRCFLNDITFRHSPCDMYYEKECCGKCQPFIKPITMKEEDKTWCDKCPCHSALKKIPFNAETPLYYTPESPKESIYACCWESKKRGIPCAHSPQPWESEFRKRFTEGNEIVINRVKNMEEWVEALVNFIKNLLLSAREEERIRINCSNESPYLDARKEVARQAVQAERARVLEAINSLQNDESRCCNCSQTRCGYNEALSEVIKLIKGGFPVE